MKVGADFEEYVHARWHALVRAAVVLGCSTPEAEDLVQTTLFQAYKRWNRVSVANDPDAYVYRMLSNAFYRSRSRRWTGEVPHRDVPDSVAIEHDFTTTATVAGAVRTLPLDQRMVVVLRYLEDRSEAEVSRILGIPMGTVKSRAARALKRLETTLQSLSPLEAGSRRPE